MKHNRNQERWKPVLGLEDRYEVSDRGRVRRLARMTRNRSAEFELEQKVLRPRASRRGYLAVNLTTSVERGRPGYKLVRTIHTLVMAAFVGPRPDGMDVCHNNGDKTDNRLENLRYDTRSANCFDTVAHGNNKSANKTHCPKGHEYTTENTYIIVRRSGPKKGHTSRTCRRCAVARADAHNKKKALLTKTGEYFRNQADGRLV